MPSLSPEELHEARRRSGRLGGRPRKPTQDEARQEALARLLPRAIRVLELHLGEGDDVNPQAWRAALRVFEYAFENPVESAEPPEGVDVADMTAAQRETLRRRILADYPDLVSHPAAQPLRAVRD